MEEGKSQTSIATGSRKGFFNNMSVYSVEFAVAMITMLILTSVLASCTYILFGLIHDIYGSRIGYGALWVSASAIVWLPVLFIFYARVRAYVASRPDVVNNSVQRGFVVAYQVVMLLSVIGFAFGAIYSLLMALVSADDVVGLLVTATLPSLLSAGIFAGAFVGFFRRQMFSRRTYLAAITVITALIVLPTIVLSVISIRHDNTTVRESRDSRYRTDRTVPYDSKSNYDSSYYDSYYQ